MEELADLGEVIRDTSTGSYTLVVQIPPVFFFFYF